LLLAAHVVVCCITLICAARAYPQYHFFFHSHQLLAAVAMVAPIATLSLLFAVAPFTFGYSVGFGLYTMLLGFVWLNTFSELSYNHRLTFFSALASAAAFLLPALLIASPLRQLYVLSPRTVGRLSWFIVALAIVTIAVGSAYSFHLVVGVEQTYALREQIVLPKPIVYAMGLTSGTLLPFAFACFIERDQKLRAALVLLVLALFYPVTLTKLSFFAPVWLVLLVISLRLFGARLTTIVSLFLPLLIGLLAFPLFWNRLDPTGISTLYFSLASLRMFAFPSLAMDYYGYFFSNHPLTHYCQIGIVKTLWHCPYEASLGQTIYDYFGIGGDFNASLFATEGIASIGATFAPIAALGAGLVVAFANRLSSGLPDRFVLVSSGMLPQILLNVPLSITLVTHGAAVLFLLWYLMPRSSFENDK
jgi:hypothetical protein